MTFTVTTQELYEASNNNDILLVRAILKEARNIIEIGGVVEVKYSDDNQRIRIIKSLEELYCWEQELEWDLSEMHRYPVVVS